MLSGEQRGKSHFSLLKMFLEERLLLAYETVEHRSAKKEQRELFLAQDSLLQDQIHSLTDHLSPDHFTFETVERRLNTFHLIMLSCFEEGRSGCPEQNVREEC